MKANEAPDKIYMPKELLSEEWTRHIEGQDIEYTRTDAFIKKAAFWLECNLSDRTMEDRKFWVEDFVNYMIGE